MDAFKILLQVSVLIMCTCVEVARGHGGMLEPPMRSVAWKYGFDAPVNYDWMSLYCGGLNNFTKNNGKCGVCGDPYDGPFENEKGGMYDTGIIVRHYPAGLREIEVKAEVTAHHRGYFQFKLCPNNLEEVTEACLDRYPLMIREGRTQGDPTRYYPPKNPKLSELHVLLPEGVICDRCVLQWKYTAGNNIGRDVQETFVNCADISIGGTVDKVPVKKQKPADGAVVVIEQRPNITKIIDQAPSDSVSEVLSALSGNTDGNADGLTRTSGPNSRNEAPGDGRQFWDRSDRPGSRTRWNNRDPRMLLPSPNDADPNVPHMHHHADTPGHTRESGFDFPRRSPMDGQREITSDWNHGGRFIGLSPFGPTPVRGQFRGQFNPFFPMRPPFPDSPSLIDRHQDNIPPPSVVTFTRSNDGHESSLNRNDRHDLDRQGSHASLLGSVDSVAGQLHKDRATGRSGSKQSFSSGPTRAFVNQMNELRRTFPNSHEWRRGDGRSSPRHAVRHSPQADTHDYTTDEVRQLVPALPSDIGPRQDISPSMDRRFNPDTSRFRGNWFPRSRVLMQRRRMRQRPRSSRRSRLPRRIEVQTMAIAQHLLRKYPQLKGRVFLSRQGHFRNQFAHMMNKYARRRNWSRV